MKQNCYIVRDLMGNYIEELVSEETAADIKEHLDECEDCSRIHRNMIEPVSKEALQNPEEKKENVREVAYLGKFRRVRKVLIIVIVAIAAQMLLYSAALVGLFYALTVGGTDTTDISQYERFLGENGEHKDNYIGYNDIFPNELPDSAEVSKFNSICKAGLDDHYLSYLVYTCSDEDYSAEQERLSKIKSSENPNVYGTKGFDSGYELCAVYAGEYGIIYALTDETDNEYVYVAIEFTDYICDIKYESIIEKEHLPIGFDAGDDNAVRQAFDEEHDPFGW